MANGTIDILMITYNRPEYTRLALTRLLETCDVRMRVWVWHNGNDEQTLAVARELSDHPRVHRFHHSPENKRLREPTNWLWGGADGDFLCKVDDDCLMPWNWADKHRQAHADVQQIGVLGSWRFHDEDFVPDLAMRKIEAFAGGHQVLKNLWVEGSGYTFKRRCLARCGLLRDGESFTRYCIRVAAAGWTNGWYYPFLYQEHMDDPRSPHSLLKTDDDLQKYLPLSAVTFGVRSLADWQAALRRDAIAVQSASLDLSQHIGWRSKARRLRAKLHRTLSRGARTPQD